MPTIKSIIDYAATIGLCFTEEDAQDALDCKPTWFAQPETTQQIVEDYLSAYGA